MWSTLSRLLRQRTRTQVRAVRGARAALSAESTLAQPQACRAGPPAPNSHPPPTPRLPPAADGTRCEALREVVPWGAGGATVFGAWPTYPAWPPSQAVDIIRWYGCNFDPPLIARAAWWRATIWSDSLLFGPFYAWAVWAYWVGNKAARLPTVAWACVIMTNVFVIMMEELDGSTSTAFPVLVSALNAPWFFVPLAAAVRMAVQDNPFGASKPATKTA